jgi:hypothetical protein
MAIKANVDLEKAHDILTTRYDTKQNCFLGEMIVVHPNTPPLMKVILSRHALTVRENERVELGGAFLQSVPEWLMDAVIEWGKRE